MEVDRGDLILPYISWSLAPMLNLISNICRAPKGCPCTPQLLCSTDERGIFNEFCDIPRAPVSTFSMHGGAGGIMSVGLLRAVSFDFMEMCVKSLYSTGEMHPFHCLPTIKSLYCPPRQVLLGAVIWWVLECCLGCQDFFVLGEMSISFTQG